MTCSFPFNPVFCPYLIVQSVHRPECGLVEIQTVQGALRWASTTVTGFESRGEIAMGIVTES